MAQVGDLTEYDPRGPGDVLIEFNLCDKWYILVCKYIIIYIYVKHEFGVYTLYTEQKWEYTPRTVPKLVAISRVSVDLSTV